MEYKSQRMLYYVLLMIISVMVGRFTSVEAYKNYTVGDSLGWYDKLAKPTLDYDSWVSGKTFSLGDFLIFNTDSNHTVIQTYNSTTCDSCDAQGDDIVQWSSIDPNSTVVRPITVAVPLLKEGTTYFFSGDYDGEQCMQGQKFAIKVSHGKGLPPSLRDNPDYALGPAPANSAPGPANADNGDDQAAPDTVISTDFNHPKKVPQDDTSSDEGEDDDDGTKKKSNNADTIMSNRNKFLVSLIVGFLVLSWIC